jgi:hypothetical protein
LQAKKTREIHAEWDEAIFRKIQKQILHYIDSIDPAVRLSLEPDVEFRSFLPRTSLSS